MGDGEGHQAVLPPWLYKVHEFLKDHASSEKATPIGLNHAVQLVIGPKGRILTTLVLHAWGPGVQSRVVAGGEKESSYWQRRTQMRQPGCLRQPEQRRADAEMRSPCVRSVEALRLDSSASPHPTPSPPNCQRSACGPHCLILGNFIPFLKHKYDSSSAEPFSTTGMNFQDPSTLCEFCNSEF